LKRPVRILFATGNKDPAEPFVGRRVGQKFPGISRLVRKLVLGGY
jgi:hypothetical protein